MINNFVASLFRRPLGIATLVAVFGAIAANYLFNLFPPQGAKISDLANGVYSDTLFIPANYAFAIWGLIYCGLIGFGFYQLRLSERRYGSVLESRPWLILACLLQTLWVYTFVQQQLLASTLLMVGLLVAVMRCYQLAEVGIRTMSGRDRLFLQHPWSLYLAWISVATIVNVSITLKEYGWNGFGLPQSLWTMVMMTVAAVLGVVVLRERRDWLYVMVVVWALLALAVRYIGNFAIFGSGLLLVCGLLGILFVGYTGGQFRQSA